LGDVAYDIAELNGTVYATDLYSNLYTVNTTTGAATLIGATGLPECPSLISSTEVSDETLFTADGNLYATFDGVSLTTLAVVDSPELYQINPATGVATPVGSTALGLDAAVQVNGHCLWFSGWLRGAEYGALIERGEWQHHFPDGLRIVACGGRREFVRH
jgi:hypothetical protein